MTRANIQVTPMTPVIGAEIRGVDLARGLDDTTFEVVHRALLDHLVIFLPEQAIGPSEQLAFARRFGTVEPPHPVIPTVADAPEVTLIEQDGSRAYLYNDVWHTDVTFRANPPLASVLHAKILPPVGGDTVWASMYAAWESLSAPIREAIDDMVAVHDFYHAFAPTLISGHGGPKKLVEGLVANPPVEHPVVRVHPETGRKGLFVNRSFTRRIVGLQPAESTHLLKLLFEHAEHPNNQVRHVWQPGTLAMWDNRCTMHLATSNFSGRRVMHRVTVLGDRPVN